MKLYVESNFLLEIALRQEESEAAWELLNGAGRLEFSLRFPEFCVAEAFSTLRFRQVVRERPIRELLQEVGQLARSSHHRSLAEALRDSVQSMASLVNQVVLALEDTVGLLFEFGTALRIDKPAFNEALRFRDRFDLRTADAVVLASIVADLRSDESKSDACFVSRDSRAFGIEPIKGELRNLNCRYIASFGDALAALRSSSSS